MKHAIAYLMMLICLTSVSIAQAQSTISWPSVVDPWINEDTLALMRCDLTKPDSSAIAQNLSEVLGMAGDWGRQVAKGNRAIQKLIEMKVPEIYVVVATSDLTTGTATLIIPASKGNSKPGSLFDELKSIWPENVRMIADTVVVEPLESIQMTNRKPKKRTDLIEAFGSFKGEQIQIGLGLGSDVRRVLREFVISLPWELGGGSFTPITDGLKWASFEVSPSATPNFELQIQAKNAEAAQVLQQMYVTIGGALTKLHDLGDLQKKTSIFSPTLQGNQLKISVSQSDKSSANYFNEVVTPLLTRIEKSALREGAVTNLKHIMLALHNYHDAYKAFPARSIKSAEGKELLSWRVEVLPYLGQGELYAEFHLNEPWDSEHNRKLIPRMPDVYVTPNVSREQRAKGMTTLLGLNGPKMVFGTPDPMVINQIIDGTSNTIAVVDANSFSAVPWTKPSDLEVDLNQILKGIVGQEGGKFGAAFWDGSVHNNLSETMDPETFRRLIQYNDGEPVGEFWGQ